MSYIDRAKDFLAADADPEVMKMAEELVDAGKAEWLDDPEHDGVVGLVRTGTNNALIVVWLAKDGDPWRVMDDWTTSGDFDDMLD